MARARRSADNKVVMPESQPSGIQVYDGVAMRARGDAVTVVYAADASGPRSRWLFERFEQLQPADRSWVVLLIIGAGARPPDQAGREDDAAAYTRLAHRLRRLVIVAEGGDFRTSLVRLVFTAYATLTRKNKLFVFAKNLQEALASVQHVSSTHTPTGNELSTDVSALKAALDPR
jgi:hypothetical protein